MGVDTKASDWFMAAHRLKVNPGASSGSLSFKIGSRVASQAALIGCAGAISGSGIPNEFFFGLDTVNMNIFGGAFSLRDIKGHIGDVHHNTSLVPGELSPTARRTERRRGYVQRGNGEFGNIRLHNQRPMDGESGAQAWGHVHPLRLAPSVSASLPRRRASASRAKRSASSVVWRVRNSTGGEAPF